MLKQISSFFWGSRRRWPYGLLSLVVALSLCIAIPKASYGASWLELLLRGAQIIQLSTISDEQEVKLGQEINQELIKSGNIKINKNPELNGYINRISQNLAQKSDRPNIPYTFQVVNDKNVNAFATMGGHVYLNTGLIETADNEAELASVIGHEIGHIAGRHAINQMRQTAIAQGLLSAAGLDRSQAVQIGVDLALSKPNSREDELEADRMGLASLQKAGYAPSGMVSFMEKLLSGGGRSVPTFLSTHPATSDRIQALEQQIEPDKANVGNGLNNQAYKNQIRSLL